MKSRILYAALGAFWGGAVFLAMLLVRNAVGNHQTFNDQWFMLVGLIVVGAIAMPMGRGQHTRD